MSARHARSFLSSMSTGCRNERAPRRLGGTARGAVSRGRSCVSLTARLITYPRRGEFMHSRESSVEARRRFRQGGRLSRLGRHLERLGACAPRRDNPLRDVTRRLDPGGHRPLANGPPPRWWWDPLLPSGALDQRRTRGSCAAEIAVCLSDVGDSMSVNNTSQRRPGTTDALGGRPLRPGSPRRAARRAHDGGPVRPGNGSIRARACALPASARSATTSLRSLSPGPRCDRRVPDVTSAPHPQEWCSALALMSYLSSCSRRIVASCRPGKSTARCPFSRRRSVGCTPSARSRARPA